MSKRSHLIEIFQFGKYCWLLTLLIGAFNYSVSAKTVVLSTGVTNDTVQANELTEAAKLNKSQGNYLKAAEQLQSAAAIYSQSNLWGEYIGSLNGAADNYRRLGDLQKAEKTVLFSIAECEKYLEHPHGSTARAYHTLGIIKDYMGQHGEAISINKRALAIFTELGGHQVQKADVFNSLGVNYLHISDQLRSSENFRKALEIFQQELNPRHQKIADLYLNIGVTYLRMERYDLAQQYFVQEMAITTENMGPNHPYVAETCINLGTVQAYLGNFQAAEEYFIRGRDIFINRFGKNDPKLIDVFNNLGLLYAEEGKFEEALFYLGETKRVISKNLGRGNIEMARLNLNLSRTYLDMGDYKIAQSAAEQARELFVSQLGSKNPLIANCYNSLARIALKMNQPDKALEYCQLGLIANNLDFSATDTSVNPSHLRSLNHSTFLGLLELKAEVLYQYHQKDQKLDALKNALATLRLADQLISEIRREQLSFEDKLHQATRTNEIYRKAVKITFELYALTEDEQYLWDAFNFSDRSKAAVLHTAIAEQSAEDFGNVPIHLLDFENRLKADRNRFQSKLQSEQSKGINGDSVSIIRYQDELFSLNRSYDSLILALERDYPQYFQLKYQEESVSIDQLQSSITDGGAVIEYFYDDDKLYSFVITKQDFKAISTSISVDFPDLIQSFRNEISTVKSAEKLGDFSKELSQLLIAPLENYLDDNQRLTIIPHGLLALVPFEILSTDSSRETSIQKRKYLLKKHPISYAFSASSLNETNEKTPNPDMLEFAGFAPSYKPTILAKAEELEPYGTLRNSLSDLAYTDDEVNLAASFFTRTNIFSGVEATESKFKSMCSNFRILHLAMHAIIDQSNPLLSKLIFTSDDTTSNDDGFLLATEIYNLNLNADMAILSACNTAFGKLIGGEGVMSLGRAFAYAGCPSIVMSLWPAQDQATAKIMGLFYEALSEGDPKDVALRKAKLAYLAVADDLFSHPFYWANFIVQGDPKPIQESNNRAMWIIFAVIGLVILLLTYTISKRRGLNIFPSPN